ncbi:SoxR reducing system RseC family protein [Rhodoferax sp. BLA1]|uniref:SoxR reducing system RseC family protein n=1 Tax=Rhodoferax sp. BLA1 TaxID=2576062 RepID=UPI0015D29A64|nr:SoxR reducing system RseC family protein [Rhodoferax sp. BLA1]
MNTRTQADEALIKGLARVVGVQGDQVWLATEAPAACGSCATQSACGSGKAKRGASWCVPRDLGPGQPLLALGEQVLVGVDRAALTRASLTAYALPLVTMLVAASALQTAGDAVAAVAALAGLLAGAAAARVLARRWREALVPVVLGRASNASGSSCPSSSAEPLRQVAIPVIERRSL